MPKLTKAEAELLELMRVDRLVLGQRQAEQAAVGEHIPAVRIERVSRRRKTVA
jgi:hypothetical protein